MIMNISKPCLKGFKSKQKEFSFIMGFIPKKFETTGSSVLPDNLKQLFAEFQSHKCNMS